MNVPHQLSCLFSATVENQDQSYVIEIPKDEIKTGYTDPTDQYQVALLSTSTQSEDTDEETNQTAEPEPSSDRKEPPVDVGETRVVEIEEIGDQGDGLTRVDRGYVVIVPKTEKGERVEIKIETVQQNVGFATVISRLGHTE